MKNIAKTILQRVAFAMLSLTLAGCQSQRPLVYETYREPAKATSKLNVYFVEKPSAHCNAFHVAGAKIFACAQQLPEEGCAIYTVKPKDFNDHLALIALGHELMHCLGAKH